MLINNADLASQKYVDDYLKGHPDWQQYEPALRRKMIVVKIKSLRKAFKHGYEQALKDNGLLT